MKTLVPALLITVTCLSLLSGCKPTAAPVPGKESVEAAAKPETPTPEPPPADDADAVAELEAKNVLLQKDGNGNVVLADFRSTETNDDDLALLTKLP
ncbi:MAG: hypothetical protein ACYTGL_26090, partial [Planctomycetota bacterium]